MHFLQIATGFADPLILQIVTQMSLPQRSLPRLLFQNGNYPLHHHHQCPSSLFIPTALIKILSSLLKCLVYLLSVSPLEFKFLSPLEDTSMLHAEGVDSYPSPLCLHWTVPWALALIRFLVKKDLSNFSQCPIFHLGSDLILEPGCKKRCHWVSIWKAEDILFLWTTRTPQPNFFPPPVETQKFSDLSSQPTRPKGCLHVIMGQEAGGGAEGSISLMACGQLGLSWVCLWLVNNTHFVFLSNRTPVF